MQDNKKLVWGVIGIVVVLGLIWWAMSSNSSEPATPEVPAGITPPPPPPPPSLPGASNGY